MLKNHIKISDDVVASVKRCELRGKELYMPDPNVVKFDNWPAMKKVFDALGGKWDKKAKAVVFPTDAAALLLPAVEAGSVLNKKQHFQFFPTPEPVALLLCQIVTGHTEQLKAHRILEPSAGDGALAFVIQAEMPNAVIDCFEIQDELRATLAKRTGREPRICDFLKLAKNPAYDFVLMNPPFQDGQDVRHVRHAYGFLKPGGRLGAIMSAGVETNEDTATREFRAWLLTLGGEFHHVPEGAFKESGTGVRTCIFTVHKPAR